MAQAIADHMGGCPSRAALETAQEQAHEAVFVLVEACNAAGLLTADRRGLALDTLLWELQQAASPGARPWRWRSGVRLHLDWMLAALPAPQRPMSC